MREQPNNEINSRLCVYLVVIHCPALGEVENTTRNTNETYYNIDVTFTCRPGYQFPDKSKQQHMYCTENATWTDYPPPCEG